MNQYFFKMTNEERNNILDQHKHVYDGYVTNYASNNEQPLYVQDFANDKGGITMNNKGEVTTYKNLGINESVLESEEDESYMVSVGEQLDMIGDGDDDFEHGTFEDDDSDIMLISPEHDEYDNEEDDYMDYVDDEEDPEFEDMDMEDILGLSMGDDDEMINSLQEQVNKSLDMFRRFKNL
jgi:hypothetical protein